MHTTNYQATLITPAPDCPAGARLPSKAGTIGALQYDMLAAAPHTMTSDDLLWAVDCARKGGDVADPAARAAFFARPLACLRASPLVKTLGWALHHDDLGRVALVDPAMPEFAALAARDDLTRLPGMRNARKG